MNYKVLVLLPLLVLSFSSWSLSGAENYQGSEKYDGMVILQVEEMDDAIHAKMQAAISADPNINLEYVCVESGIVVVKFANSTLPEKVDNEMLVRRKFQGCVPANGMKTILVDMYVSMSVSKC